jgi:hypothetical protein
MLIASCFYFPVTFVYEWPASMPTQVAFKRIGSANLYKLFEFCNDLFIVSTRILTSPEIDLSLYAQKLYHDCVIPQQLVSPQLITMKRNSCHVQSSFLYS